MCSSVRFSFRQIVQYGRSRFPLIMCWWCGDRRGCADGILRGRPFARYSSRHRFTPANNHTTLPPSILMRTYKHSNLAIIHSTYHNMPVGMTSISEAQNIATPQPASSPTHDPSRIAAYLFVLLIIRIRTKTLRRHPAYNKCLYRMAPNSLSNIYTSFTSSATNATAPAPPHPPIIIAPNSSSNFAHFDTCSRIQCSEAVVIVCEHLTAPSV